MLLEPLALRSCFGARQSNAMISLMGTSSGRLAVTVLTTITFCRYEYKTVDRQLGLR